jgi:hypothetical protein
VLSAAELETRKEELKEAPDLRSLLDRLILRAAPVLTRMPMVPAEKALLSSDGGFCPDDGAGLEFDPWSPHEHRCPRCGRGFSGDRHDRAWARFQHLWLAERAAHLATIAALGDRDDAAARASEILGCYAERYLQYPNRDNVLGPSHLFFSTYLESIWLANFLAAATLLRECGRLDQELADAVGAVADEAANLIGEFDEGFSNRQTWHNAALAAVAVWFEDEELATRAVESPTGVIAHLVRGFGEDGMWYEGENYHLFALRGELLAMNWARQAGVDLLADPRLAERLETALRAPALTALPDHTFPARKDSRFAVSLAQPMYLELWEVGLGRLGGEPSGLAGWLGELYAAPPPAAERFDSYLHEAGEPAPTRPRSRADLSWWSLLEMAPSLPHDVPAWNPGNVLLESQGLPILRTGTRYTSLECGVYGGGHGHPDRLHLTLHADGRHWLADPGAGSYVARDLLWYRSTLAHNAPRLDGVSQPVADATCDAFDTQGDWGWAQGSFGQLTRTLVAGPRYLLDLVDLSATDEHLLELPWHLDGRVEIVSPGSWTADTLEDEFVSDVERFVPATEGALVLQARADNGAPALRVHLLFQGELLRAQAPGRPGSSQRVAFYLARARGRNLRLVATLEPSGSPMLQGLRLSGEVIEADGPDGSERHLPIADGWDVTLPAGTVRLRGRRQATAPVRPLIDLNRPVPVDGVALHAHEPPSLDGSLDGFDADQPMVLDHEDQYRRSEEPYPGPDEFSASVVANWDADALYLGIEVVKQDVVPRDDDAPALHLDNEPDDIHADGVQLYLRPGPEAPVYGFLVALAGESGEIRVRPTGGTTGRSDMVQGSWQRTESGYGLTLAIAIPEWQPRSGDTIDFDILINRAKPDRLRRAGQLVWSGGGGWVYLRGDRQDPARFGVLELG